MKKTIQSLLITLLAVILAACTPSPPSPFSTTQANLLPWDNVWVAMRHNFNFPVDVSQPAVQAQIRWYMHHSHYLNRILLNATPYIAYIYQQTQLRHLPAELALLPIIESNYKPYAYSNAGAMGLWQLMPGTASGFGLKIDWWYDGRRSVVASTRAALTYLTYLHAFFDDHWLQAIAAYNSGEGTVQNAIRYNRHHKKATNFWALGLPQETQRYVPKLLALTAIIEDPSKYHITLPDIDKNSRLTTVDIHSQIDLALAAKLADMKLKNLHALNAGDLRWATDPSGPYTLLLPSGKVSLFELHLSELPKQDRVTWWHYRVRLGDNLNKIAQRYHTQTHVLKRVNHLHSNMLHIGQGLLIPQNMVRSNIAATRHSSLRSQPRHGPQRLVYRVQRGDSLKKIAHAHHVSEREILFWNKGLNKNLLKPGETMLLWIPVHHGNRLRPVSHALIYHVHPGDTLNTIAARFHTTVKSIQRLNHLYNDTIHSGERLVVGFHGHINSTLHTHSQATTTQTGWIHYTIKAGDTLNKIAQAHHTTAQHIEKWNDLKANYLLRPGEKLALYVG